MKHITRIVQVIWLAVAAVCSYEAYAAFKIGTAKAWLYVAIGLFALFRYGMLRRMQMRKKSNETS